MNNTTLQSTLSYLEALLRYRLNQDFAKKNTAPPQVPILSADDSFGQFLRHYQATTEEWVVLTLGLLPHIMPYLIDSLVAEHLPKGGDFPALGGVKGQNHRGIIPTGETAMYLLAGHEWQRRLPLQALFTGQHYFAKHQVLRLEDMKPGEPPLSGRIILDQDYVELFTLGRNNIPSQSTSFPAQHIQTQLEWSDLVLNEHTMAEIRELETWVQHNNTLLHDWGLHKKIKPGFRVLFHGPPGTGKTLTASLLGKYTGREVFRVDLSSVVSKYIGETEKNLASLFDKAQNKNWILFFDEADSLFSKRTGVRDAHDKYANQEVSFLLQRIETFAGLTILATNFKTNIDEAFTRRFNAVIQFPYPQVAERLRLWQQSLPTQLNLAPDIKLQEIAKHYELTGAHVINVVQRMSLEALRENRNTIRLAHFKRAIMQEMAKEGKPL